MSNTYKIGPLTVDVQLDRVVLCFTSPNDSFQEVRPTLEQDLASCAAGRSDEFERLPIIFSLSGVQGLSSRHLGILVTAEKALRKWGGCTLRGVTPTMRRQLEVTQIIQLFPRIEA